LFSSFVAPPPVKVALHCNTATATLRMHAYLVSRQFQAFPSIVSNFRAEWRRNFVLNCCAAMLKSTRKLMLNHDEDFIVNQREILMLIHHEIPF
jgi:hypothetical protein